MELRSGRRLVYLPPERREGGHRRRSRQCSEDWINGLPEHLLLEILVRLGSAAGAAHAGAVCRGWRSLWTELPELTFWDANPQPVMSALARITRPSLDLLEIYLMARWGDNWAGQISLLLRAAPFLITLDTHFVDMQPNGLLDAELSITQVMAHLPELDLATKEHTFVPLMLCLLRIQPTMQRLKVVLARDKVRMPCPVNCPCEHPVNWRSEDIPLADLEVVEIHGLQGEDDEVDFLKIILRCATVLRRLTMTISNDVSPCNNGYEKICSIMKEHPDVECHIMASGSDAVLYP